MPSILTLTEVINCLSNLSRARNCRSDSKFQSQEIETKRKSERPYTTQVELKQRKPSSTLFKIGLGCLAWQLQSKNEKMHLQETLRPRREEKTDHMQEKRMDGWCPRGCSAWLQSCSSLERILRLAMQIIHGISSSSSWSSSSRDDPRPLKGIEGGVDSWNASDREGQQHSHTITMSKKEEDATQFLCFRWWANKTILLYSRQERSLISLWEPFVCFFSSSSGHSLMTAWYSWWCRGEWHGNDVSTLTIALAIMLSHKSLRSWYSTL